MRRLGLVAAFAIALLVPVTAQAASHEWPMFGAVDPNNPYDGSRAGIAQLEQDTDRAVDIVNWFQQWQGPAGDPWTTEVHSELFRTAGDGTMLTWEPWLAGGGADQPNFSLARINAGIHDSYIHTFARNLSQVTRTVGVGPDSDFAGRSSTQADTIEVPQTVYLRLMHEMNGDWYPWSGVRNGNTPTEYRLAWQRIVNIFRSEEASNVKFVWSPYTFDVGASPPGAESNAMENYFPGDDYVDVLALDGYNWGDANGGWLTFSQLFGQGYSRLVNLPGNDPIWIAEVGCAPDGAPAGTDKAAWVRDMWAQVKTPAWSQLEAIVWFNEDKERDWRANADPLVAAAFDPGTTD